MSSKLIILMHLCIIASPVITPCTKGGLPIRLSIIVKILLTIVVSGVSNFAKQEKQVQMHILFFNNALRHAVGDIFLVPYNAHQGNTHKMLLLILVTSRCKAQCDISLPALLIEGCPTVYIFYYPQFQKLPFVNEHSRLVVLVMPSSQTRKVACTNLDNMEWNTGLCLASAECRLFFLT